MSDIFRKPHFWGIVLATAVLIAAIAFFNTDPAQQAASQHAEAVADTLAKPEAGVETLAPGIDYKVVEAGSGELVVADYIRFDATVWTTEGETVMSSQADGTYVLSFDMLDAMVPGLAAALRAMPAGETRRYWIAQEKLGKGFPGAPSGDVIADLTVLGGKDPLPAPANVAAIPAEATVTDSGLAYTVMEDAATDTSPTLLDEVTVHYTGWQTDGTMFDSSVLRGEPATFPLDRLIEGWQEGIPLMTVGDVYRFWIPAKLAYGENPRPGAPKGMLVFDIELVAVSSDADDTGSGKAD